MEKKPFGRFSTSQGHPAALCGILDSGRLATIFARLEPTGLCYLAHFCQQSSGYASRKSTTTIQIIYLRFGFYVQQKNNYDRCLQGLLDY
jgi:hypothetical protein